MPTSRQLFESSGALKSGHFVFTTGLHSNQYVDKDLALSPSVSARIHGWNIAREFVGRDIEVVVSPAEGAIALGARVADALTDLENREILFGVLRKDSDSPYGFTFRSSGADWASGKKILVVEDVLTTGTSARNAVGAVRAAGAEVTGLAAFANREGITAQMLGVPELFILLDVPAQSWSAENCPLCFAGKPIDTILGHGSKK